MHRLFRDAESYHATRADKTCHWTRHPSRLDRELGRKRFVNRPIVPRDLVRRSIARMVSLA
jgi:antirestriction protein ArdC